MRECILKHFEEQLKKCLLEPNTEIHISLIIEDEYFKVSDPDEARAFILNLPEGVRGYATVWTTKIR